MISFIRKWLTSWPVIVLLGLVLVAFAITGVGDPFGSAAPAGSIAKVGGQVITEPQLLAQIDRIIRNARAQDPKFSQTQLAKEGGVPLVAEQMIGTAALEQLAASMGIGASDRAVGAEIAAIPAFQSGGKFDEATYRRIIAEQRLSDRELRSGVAGDIVRKQLIAPVTGALQVPRGMAEPYVRLLADVHRGSVAIVPLGAATPAAEAEIAAFYKANAARFTVPERRSFRYAMIDRAAIAARSVPTEAVVAAAFAKDRARYGGEATRILSQVVVPDEAKAREVAAAAARQGFAAAAQVAGFAPADTSLGAQTQSQFGAATSPAVAAAAFALPVGSITAPIKTDFGWHVVKVDALGSAGKTLDQARPAIVTELSKRNTDTALGELVAKIEDGAEAGQSFADLAKATGLTIQTAPAVTREGRTGADPASALPANLLPLAVKAFGHDPQDGVAVEDLGGGNLVAIETVQVVPPAPQPLAEVRAQVAAAVATDKAMQAAKRRADAVIAAVRKGTPFAAAVAAQGLAAPQPLAGRRMDVMGQTNVPGVITAFLSTPVKTVRALPGAQGYALVNVDSIEPAASAAVQAIFESTRREIAAQAPQELGNAFALAAGRSIGVERNAAQINAVSRRLSGISDGQQ